MNLSDSEKIILLFAEYENGLISSINFHKMIKQWINIADRKHKEKLITDYDKDNDTKDISFEYIEPSQKLHSGW